MKKEVKLENFSRGQKWQVVCFNCRAQTSKQNWYQGKLKEQVKYSSLCRGEIQPYMLVIPTNSYHGRIKLKQGMLPVHLKLASIFVIQKTDWIYATNWIYGNHSNNGLLWAFEDHFSYELKLEILVFNVTLISETYSCQL